MKQKKQNNPDTLLEKALLKKGYKYVIGIDEVGRGSWAGPVAVGGYIYSIDSKEIPGVKDSKLLSSQKREYIYNDLFDSLNSFVEFGEVDLINEIGITKTIELLINKIILRTFNESVFYLIDGVFKEGFVKNSRKIVKGDLKHYSISCASIIAKVQRDRLMKDLAKTYPGYYFESNKGYGTKKHQESLKNYGISKIHRINYKPIALLYKSDVKRIFKQS